MAPPPVQQSYLQGRAEQHASFMGASDLPGAQGAVRLSEHDASQQSSEAQHLPTPAAQETPVWMQMRSGTRSPPPHRGKLEAASPRSTYSSFSKASRISEVMNIPYVQPFSFPLFNMGESTADAEETFLEPYCQLAEVPMVGLGLLLEQVWVAKQTAELTLTDAFVSLDGKRESVWRVKSMAAGFGADRSGLICAGDILVRVNGQSIPGVVCGAVPRQHAMRLCFRNKPSEALRRRSGGCLPVSSENRRRCDASHHHAALMMREQQRAMRFPFDANTGV